MSSPLKRKVTTTAAPNPFPKLFSQAIVANGMVFCSGNIGLDPATNKVVEGDIKARTHQTLKNISSILKAAGTSMENVVKVKIFIADYADFGSMNEAYVRYSWEGKPCRTCIGAKQLPFGTDVETECIAVLP